MENNMCNYCRASFSDLTALSGDLDIFPADTISSESQAAAAGRHSVMTYLCKYTPVELMHSFGVSFDMPNQETPDFSQTEPWLHSMLCSHAKMLMYSLLEKKNSSKELILTTCCDSIRRVWDALPGRDCPQADEYHQKAPFSAKNHKDAIPDAPEFSFRKMLDLPHSQSTYAKKRYARELLYLLREYSAYSGKTADREIFLEDWKRAADFREDFLKKEKHKDFIAVLGARPSDELFRKIEASLLLPAVNLTCGGFRLLPQPPENARELSGEDLMEAYAGVLLEQIPCMRMEDVTGRKKLLQIPGLRGVIYHTVKFCDFYSFEYAQLCRETELPVLKIESDYTSQGSGQIAARLAAFEESLETRGEAASDKNTGRYPADGKTKTERDAIFLGIDSGSTTTNAAAIDAAGNLLAFSIVRTGARAGKSAERAFQDIRRQLGRDSESIRCITATGYGRESIPFADAVKTEISCHARGAHFADPSVRTIIDIGGQDSKIICLDEDGNVMNFVMNDKCAAGTGRFLEMMAHTLELDMDAMSRLGLSWKKDLNITSTCSVFAESEVVSLIAQDARTPDIVHALNKSVAHKTCGMVRRVRGSGPYMMTGGVARNKGVVKEIERNLEAPLSIMPHPDLIGALGAALFAAERL